MRTTVEIPDNLYRQIKAHAALKGQTIKAFFLDAVREKMAGSSPESSPSQEQETGWRAVFGKADPGDMAELQRIIDEDCRKIDYAEWGLPDPDAPS